MSIKSKIPFFLAMGALFGRSGIGVQPFKNKKGHSAIPYGVNREIMVPKGCKIFYFAPDGHFSMHKSSNTPIEIVALNKKNAIRKFKNHLNAKS
jgi:hypothetical protein